MMVERPAPQALCDKFQEAWNAHDMAAFGTLFDVDATFIGRFGTFMRGRAEIESTHRRVHDGLYRNSVIAISEPEVALLGDDVVVMLFKTRLTIDETKADAETIDTFAQAVVIGADRHWRIRSMANVELQRPGA